MLAPRFSHLPAVVLLALAATTCWEPSPAGYEVASQGIAGEALEIDFSARPSYLDSNVIVLTFDDGPDRTNTPLVLDILRDKAVKASFFINTNNQTMVANDGVAQALLRRIVSEGHELATHTVNHLDLTVQTPEKIEEEIAGVEATVKAVFGANAPPLTLLRVPFGRPYQSAPGSAAYQKVAPVVARHAVHIGWAIDSNDWRYANDPDQVYNHVTGLIKQPGQGAYGVMLLHSIHPQTVAALPRLIDYMRGNGFVFKLTEDVVRARFAGRTSAELLRAAPPPPVGGSGGSGGGGSGGSAGTGGAAAGSSGAGGRPSDAGTGSDAAGGFTGQDAAAGAGGSEGGGRGGGGAGGGGSTGTAGAQGQPAASGGVTGGCSFAGRPASTPALVLALALGALAFGSVRRRWRG